MLLEGSLVLRTPANVPEYLDPVRKRGILRGRVFFTRKDFFAGLLLQLEIFPLALLGANRLKRILAVRVRSFSAAEAPSVLARWVVQLVL